MIDHRQHAPQLIDRLPDLQLTALIGLLEAIIDPVAAALRDAPSDGEDDTDEERTAAAEARSSLQRAGGKGIPHAEDLSRLGLE